MLKIKFLKNVLIVSLFIVIIFPLLNTLFIYPLFTNLLVKNTEDEAVRVGKFLMSIVFSRGIELTEDSITRNLSKDIEDIKRDLQLMKLKIFSLNGKVIYSTDKSDIGKTHEHEIFYRVVAKGNVYTKMVKKDAAALDESRVTIDVVETYVPLMKDNRVIGAFEIYYDISKRKAALDKLTLTSSSAMIIMALGLTGMLLIALLKAKKAIVARDEAENLLREKHRALEEINALIEKDRHNLHSALNEISQTIKDIERNAIEDKYNYILENNPNLVTCWETLNCSYDKCPVYGQRNVRCWQMVGTHCGGEVQGWFARKFGNCDVCDVYMEAIKEPIWSIKETFYNMMHLLQRVIRLDPLTGIGNRRSFYETIERMHNCWRRYSKEYSLIMLDIDNFKTYNDTYGHMAGDQILRTIANSIRQTIRLCDCIFRYGGEEVVIVLPEQNKEAALVIAERIRKNIEALATEHKGSSTGILTVSCGVSSINIDDKDIKWETVLERADRALYIAKSSGKNRVCFL